MAFSHCAHNVRLDEEAWDRLTTWIDLNTPCHGSWSEFAPIADSTVGPQRERRLAMRKLYGGLVADDEELLRVSQRYQGRHLSLRDVHIAGRGYACTKTLTSASSWVGGPKDAQSGIGMPQLRYRKGSCSAAVGGASYLCPYLTGPQTTNALPDELS